MIETRQSGGDVCGCVRRMVNAEIDLVQFHWDLYSRFTLPDASDGCVCVPKCSGARQPFFAGMQGFGTKWLESAVRLKYNLSVPRLGTYI